jgi:uncharacterized protein (TIGR02453 family)
MMNTSAALDFLSQLNRNNNREWFQQNKRVYDEIRKDYETFVAEMISEISMLDPSIGLPDCKDCIFRIYRDVRFSSDKSPYKTHFGAFIGKGGCKTTGVGYYIHIEPGKSMVAGGVYQPQPYVLKQLRNEIYFNSAEFKKIITDSKFVKSFGQLDDFDKMKLAPKDFPADFQDIDLLKYKSYIVGRDFTDSEVVSDDFKMNILGTFAAMLPLHDFLKRAMNNG